MESFKTDEEVLREFVVNLKSGSKEGYNETYIIESNTESFQNDKAAIKNQNLSKAITVILNQQILLTSIRIYYISIRIWKNIIGFSYYKHWQEFLIYNAAQCSQKEEPVIGADN